MKKQVGFLSAVGLLAIYEMQTPARLEAANAVLFGSVLLAVAATIRHKG
jgi:hypothetical protein